MGGQMLVPAPIVCLGLCVSMRPCSLQGLRLLEISLSLPSVGLACWTPSQCVVAFCSRDRSINPSQYCCMMTLSAVCRVNELGLRVNEGSRILTMYNQNSHLSPIATASQRRIMGRDIYCSGTLLYQSMVRS